VQGRIPRLFLDGESVNIITSGVSIELFLSAVYHGSA